MEIIDIVIGISAVVAFLYLFAYKPYMKRKTTSKLVNIKDKNNNQGMN